MQFSFFEESIRLLFLNCNKNPGKFVKIFNRSDYLIGFNYCCTEKRFTHVSNSFKRILGYDLDNILNSGNFSSKILHPHDKHLLEEYLKVIPALKNNPGNGTNLNSYKRTKCRAKHIKGYWKYFIIFTINYHNPRTKAFNKIGVIADEHMRQHLMLNSGNLDDLPISFVNFESESTNRDYKERNVAVSPRESQILELISRGIIAKNIAKKLNISLNTVITHRKNLLFKFNVRNTAEMIRKAAKIMLI